MRRIDKLNNIIKANLLLEKRYLESKGLLKEEAEEKVKITSSNSYGDMTYIGQMGREGEGLYYFKPEKGGFEFIPKGSGELPSWVRSTEEEFNKLINRKLPINMEGGGQGIKIGGEPNLGNMLIPPLIYGEDKVTIEKI